MVGDWLVLESEGLGLILRWDLQDRLALTAEPGLWNRTAGLCGSLTGNPYDDLGEAAGLAAWLDRWTLECEEEELSAAQINFYNT